MKPQSQFWKVILGTIFTLALSSLFLFPKIAYANLYDADSPVTYKEYWVSHSGYNGGCPAPDPVTPSDQWYIEPKAKICEKTLTFTIPDNINNALKAEIFLDLWRNHDEQTIRFSLNGGPLRAPNVGSDWSRTPYVAPLLLTDLRQGTNTILFSSDGSLRLAHVHDIAIRIYYNASNPLLPGLGSDVTPPTAALVTLQADNGSFTPSDGGSLLVDSNQLVLTATATDIDYIEFHAYYEGQDLDNDGIFREWQSRNRHNCHLGGSVAVGGCRTPKPPVGGTIDHIGSTGPAGTFSNCAWNGATSTATCTWDMRHVTNQAGVRFKVRAIDAAGNVSEAAGGVSNEFALLRNNPTAAFINPNFVDAVLHHNGDPGYADAYSTTVDLPANVSGYNVAYLLGSYYQNPKIFINSKTKFIRPFVQGSVEPKDDMWTLAIQEIPDYRVFAGVNTIEYTYASGWGHFIERPGPMVVLRRSGAGFSDSAAPVMTNFAPLNGSSNVDPGQVVTVYIADDLGVGVDYTSLQMRINGNLVSPQISGFSNQYKLAYKAPGGFANSTTYAVTIDAKDLLGNVMPQQSFNFTIEDPDVTPPVISNVQILPGFNQAIISWNTDEPATSRIDFGLSTAVYTGTISASAYITQHRLALLDLTPDMEYHFSITAADSDNNSAATADALFRTLVQIPMVSDDFNYCNALKPMWEFVNPRGDATLTLNGQELMISVPGGIEHDVWPSGSPIIRAPHVLQSATDPNLMHVKFATGVSAGIQQQGILAIQDATNFVRVNFQYQNGAVQMIAIRVRNGSARVVRSSPVVGASANAPLYLRILRDQENRWRPSYSLDGTTWTMIGLFTEAYSINKVGVYAGNSSEGGSVPAFTAVIDYFENSNAPIPAEDAIAQLLPVSANPADKGSVTKSVACGNPVTLTAAAVPGWSFSGWSGAATGVVNPIDVSFGAGDFVVANFTQDKYNVITGTVGSGDVTYAPPQAEYVYGETITLQATPQLGWSFAGWSGDVVGATNPANLTMTSSKTVTATFTQNQYTLSATPSDPAGGSITVSPEGAYTYGNEVTLVATATPGWTFVGWSGDAAGTESSILVSMTGNKSITAIFTKDQYTLTSNAVGNGTVKRNPDKLTYDFGDPVTLTAEPTTGWKLDRWEGGVTGTLNSATLTMNANTTVTAIFTKTRHTLTNAVIGNGSLIINPDKPFYFYGDEVTVTVLPATGWTLDGWSGDATGRANPITLVMNGNKAVVARFVEAPHLLTTTTTGQGTITRSPDLQSFKEGDTVALTAVPAPGWGFTGWSGAATGTANPVMITMNDDKTVSANFTRIGYTVAVAVASTVNNTNPAGNTATVNPNQALYNYGDAVTLTAVAAEGWTFAGWNGGFTGLATSAQLTVAADLNITALFTPTLYELNIAGGQNSEGGQVTVSKAAPYTHGEVITLTAVPATGYRFVEWDIANAAEAAGTTADAPQITVTIPDSRTFRARFEKVDVAAERQIFLPFVSR